jgi:hypothetical protein
MGQGHALLADIQQRWCEGYICKSVNVNLLFIVDCTANKGNEAASNCLVLSFDGKAYFGRTIFVE